MTPDWREELEQVWQIRISRLCDWGHVRTETNTQVRRSRGGSAAVVCRECRGWLTPRDSQKAWHQRVRHAERDAEEALRELRVWVLEQRLTARSD